MERPRFAPRERKLFPIELIGADILRRIPQEYPPQNVNYVLAPNHPSVSNPFQLRGVRDGLDPEHEYPAYGFMTNRFMNRDRKVMARVFSQAEHALDARLIPVPQEGSNSGGLRQTIETIHEILKGRPTGNIFVLFPEGQSSKNGEVGTVSRTVVKLMRKQLSPALIIPVGITPNNVGHNFYLPRPLQAARVTIGEPYMAQAGLTGEQVRESLTRLL